MKNVAQHHKDIFRHVLQHFDVDPEVRSCGFDGEEEPFDIGYFVGAPTKGTSMLTTLGLSDLLASDDGDERFELVAVTKSKFDAFDEVVMFAAHLATEDPARVQPGAVLEKLVATRYTKANAAHAYFTERALLGATLAPTRALGKDVTFLFLVPITSEELAYLETHGRDALELALVGSASKLVDLDRGSLVGKVEPAKKGAGKKAKSPKTASGKNAPKTARPAKPSPVKTRAAKTSQAKKAFAKTAAAKKASVKKTSAKTASAKKTSVKKASAKKTSVKKASAKKTFAKKASPAKKPRRSGAKRS